MTARILTSRNKREGGYLGRYRSVHDRDYAFDQQPLRRHHRKGNSSWRTLREGVCHFYPDNTLSYLSPAAVAVFKGMPMFGGAA